MTTTAAPASANAFHYPAYVKYLVAATAHGFSAQILSMAVSWQVYDITRSAFYLGLVGLAQFLPALLLVLVTGLVADRFNRRLVMLGCLLLELIGAAGLVWFTLSQTKMIWPVFVILALLGVARAFFNPSSDALSPNLIAKEAIPHAISLGSMTWQVSSITGPVVGGLLYGFGGHVAYGTGLILFALAAVMVMWVGHVRQENKVEETTLGTLFAGFHFIKSEPVVLGAISLDLFAVLLGGATALLPIYARDILQVGEFGLGLLRGAPGVGAVVMALWLAKFGIKDRAGWVLFSFVAAFGFFTMVFGVSTWVPLSIFALTMMGACDMVSVYVRETLMQLWTPDEVRGRVNAVNRVFIGASNELGEFRAGSVAALLSAKVAVVMGGVGTMLVAAGWARMFPQLRTARKLEGKVEVL
jgi:MFS family permease